MKTDVMFSSKTDTNELTPTFDNLAETARQAGEAMVIAIKAMNDYLQLFCSHLPYMIGNIDKLSALVEASPRVRRLALYGKKYRTRKKNINRALREKAKRENNNG